MNIRLLNLFLLSLPFGISLIFFAAPLPTHAQNLCGESLAQFHATDEITCGSLTWKLHPFHAQLLSSGNALHYLSEYQKLYDHLKEFTGYEPKDKKVIIMEQCAPDSAGPCPNGRMKWNYPMFVLGSNTIYVTDDFFRSSFPVLAGDTTHRPLSSSLFHEMGHVFTPSAEVSNAYIWDNSLREGYADIIGIFSYTMITDALKGKEFGRADFYWDGWCVKKGKPAVCTDYYSTVNEYLSVGHDRDYEDYLSKDGTFDTLFPFPESRETVHKRGGVFTDMLANIYRDFAARNDGMTFAGALKKTITFYNTALISPDLWKTDSVLTRSSKLQVFATIISMYAKTDLAPFFQRWNFPIAKGTKDAIVRARQKNFPESALSGMIADALKLNLNNVTSAATPRRFAIRDEKNGTQITLSWVTDLTRPPAKFKIYRTESNDYPTPLLAEVEGSDGGFIDRGLYKGSQNFYEVTAVDATGNESGVTTRLSSSASTPPTKSDWDTANKLNPETKDHPLPTIIDAGGTAGETTATLFWSMDRPVIAEIWYGTDKGWQNQHIKNENLAPSGMFTLSSLTPGTRHYYTLAFLDPETNRQAKREELFVDTLPRKATPVEFGRHGVLPLLEGVMVKDTGTSNSVKISWNRHSWMPYASVHVYRAIKLGGSFEFIGGSLNDGNQFIYDNDVESGRDTYYRVIGTTESSEVSSAATAFVNVSPFPSQEPSYLFLNMSGSVATIGWQIPFYYNSYNSVTVYRSEEKGTLGEPVGRGITTNSFTDNLLPGKRYYYTVRIVTKKGYESHNTRQLVAQSQSNPKKSTDIVKKKSPPTKQLIKNLEELKKLIMQGKAQRIVRDKKTGKMYLRL